MKRLRIYVWFAAFVFLANAWLCYAFSSSNVLSSDLSPIWQRVLTYITLISQLPALPFSKIIAEWFGVSYPGWALATSVISMLIYFPLINLAGPWALRLSMGSIRRNVAVFSASLNPRIPVRKGAKSLVSSAQAVARLSSRTFDLPDPSSAVAVSTSPSHTLIAS